MSNNKGLHGFTTRNKSNEVTEVYLDRLYEKQGSHIKFYCPNCKCCITKISVHDPPPPNQTFSRPSHFNFSSIHGNNCTVSNNVAADDICIESSDIISLPQCDAPSTNHSGSREILKSIVYGGLTELITSLAIVTSAAGAGAATLNVVSLAFAYLFGGLFITAHNLSEFKHQSATNYEVEAYQEVLGKRENFCLHFLVAMLSFLVFGSVPPLVYGFSFPESGDRDHKLGAVAMASLICIALLALAKAGSQRPPRKFIKTILYYVGLGFVVLSVSYLAGDLIHKLILKFGWFQSSTEPITLPLSVMDTMKAIY